MTPTQGDKTTLLGIYKIEKTKLTIVYSESGGVRPKSLAETGTSVIVCRRVKAKK